MPPTATPLRGTPHTGAPPAGIPTAGIPTTGTAWPTGRPARALVTLMTLTLMTVALLALAGLAGCSDDDDPPVAEQLPSGASLVSQAATAAEKLTSAHVTIEVKGEIGGVPMRRADGDLLRSGDAKGTIGLSQFGLLIEYQFVVVGKAIYLKGVTGGWQELDAAATATIYDPSAILDSNRGIPKLLATAQEPATEAREKVGDKDAYRVAVRLSGGPVSALVPGISGDVPGKVWLDTQTKQLLKAVLTVPGATAGQTGEVTIDLSNIDVPVTISAP